MVDLRQSPKTSTGKDRIQIDPPEGSRLDVISPNWCDKTTWFEKSQEAADETLSDSGDGLLFNSAEDFWVDTSHGKLTGEDILDQKYKPIIKVDGNTMVEDTPFNGGDGDYSINYATGDVTFSASQSGKTVTATYWHATSSEWTIAPAAGRVLRLTTVEVQFSRNIDLKDTVKFQAYGLVDVFAPHLLDTADPAGPFPSGTKIPLGNPTVYKTMMDFINEAAGSYAEIPAMGGDDRGVGQPIQIFRWPYAERAATDLPSAAGMEIRISLENDNAFLGDMAVATFYGVSESEVPS